MQGTILQRSRTQQSIASLGFTLSDVSRFATRNPNILQTLFQQLTNEREKKDKTKLLLNRANDVRLINERLLLHHWPSVRSNPECVFVDIPSEIDVATRTDVLTLMKIQFCTDVSFAGSATHDDLSTTALKNFHEDTYLNPHICNKSKTAMGFGY